MQYMVVLAVILFAGCRASELPQGSDQASRSSAEMEDPDADDEEADTAILTLAEFRLDDAEGRTMTVSAEGAVSVPRGEMGQVHVDGTVIRNDGTPWGRLLRNGQLLDAKGDLLATIAEDATTKIDDIELHFDASGLIQGGAAGQSVKLIPADSPARRTAMVVTILVLTRPSEMGLAPRDESG